VSKSLKRILSAIVGLMGLLIFASFALFLFVYTNMYKTRLEQSASDALGMGPSWRPTENRLLSGLTCQTS
jgi:hypothetical protein